MKQRDRFIIFGWTAVIIFAIIKIILGIFSAEIIVHIAPFISTFFLFSFAFYHGMKRYGIKNILIFLSITFIVSWSYENMSIITGFPFGHYYYTAALGPKLWLVPFYVMFGYFGVGYLSWTIAHILLDKFDNRMKGLDVFFIPVIASFVMVIWDVCTDPNCSTIRKLWIWKDGGAFFGVPVSNFLGWYLCVFTIYLIFAFYLSLRKKQAASEILVNKIFWILPVLMYMAIVIQFPFTAMFGDNVQVMSLDNHIWWTYDINGSLLMIALFTMLFISLLSLFKLVKSPYFILNSEQKSSNKQ